MTDVTVAKASGSELATAYSEYKIQDSEFKSGHHTIKVAQYGERFVALKPEELSAAVYEVIKYDLARKAGLTVPDARVVIDEKENATYIATEIMPGFVPMGFLTQSFDATLSGMRCETWQAAYATWTKEHGLPQDAETKEHYAQFIAEYKKLDSKAQETFRVSVVGFEPLFASCVLLDDQVPLGRVKLVRERNTNYLGLRFSRDHYRSLKSEEEKKQYVDKLMKEQEEENRKEQQKLFGNVLLKLCYDPQRERYYFQVAKIDLDGGFFSSSSPSKQRLQRLYTHQGALSDAAFRSECRSDPNNNDIGELYGPLLSIPELCSPEQRLASAEQISKCLTPDVIKQSVITVIDQLPEGLRKQFDINAMTKLIATNTECFTSFVEQAAKPRSVA